jgi:mannose-6-phosphate isomerase-like protein (cupin superfamily)
MTIADTERFREFSNPATGERIRVTAIAEDGEDVIRFNWRSMPGGAITEHLHPHQEERFIIAAGEAHFTVNGEKRVAGPGETVVVPIGVRHSESNPGAVAIEGVVELRPALHTKELFEAFAGLGSEGKTTARGRRRIRFSSERRSGTSAMKAEPPHLRSGSRTSSSRH